MGTQIDAMTPLSPPVGTELMFVDSSGPRSVTVNVLKQFVIDAIEAIAAGTVVDGNDKIFILDNTDSVMKPVDIDTVLQYQTDVMWAKAAETTADDADVILLKDGGSTEKTLTLDKLGDFILADIEARMLDFSDVADGSGTIATSDYMCVTQTTTPKRIQISDLSTLIYDTLDTHVTGLTGTVTVVGTDELYFVRGGTGDKMTALELATYVATQVAINGSGTADYVPKWTDSDTLEAGYSVATSAGGGFAAGSETELATTQAIRDELDDLITDGVVHEHFFPAAIMHPRTTNGAAAAATNEYATNDVCIRYFAFDGTTSEAVQAQLQMPPGWNRGTVKFKFHWSSDTGSTAADTVEWAARALAIGNDDALDAAFGTAQVISDALIANNGTDMQLSGATPAVTIGGSPALGDMIVFEFYRNVAGTDDMTEDAWLFGVTMQYTTDKVVSAW